MTMGDALTPRGRVDRQLGRPWVSGVALAVRLASAAVVLFALAAAAGWFS
jgi:hypothetical protein